MSSGGRVSLHQKSDRSGRKSLAFSIQSAFSNSEGMLSGPGVLLNFRDEIANDISEILGHAVSN